MIKRKISTLLLTFLLLFSGITFCNTNVSAAANGWNLENGTWYYYQGGYRATNAWKLDSVGWCYLGSDGKWVTNGWVKDSHGWCYLGTTGYWDGKPALASIPETNYGLGQTVTVNDYWKGTYEITINSIQITSERNQFADNNPIEVYKVNYTYKLLKLGQYSHLWLYDPFDSVDSTGEAGDTYPDNKVNDPKDLKVEGSYCTADTFIGVKNKTNSLKLVLSYYTASFENGSIIFNIPTK